MADEAACTSARAACVRPAEGRVVLSQFPPPTLRERVTTAAGSPSQWIELTVKAGKEADMRRRVTTVSWPLLALLVMGLASGCGGSSGTQSQSGTVTSVSVLPATATVQAGASVQFSATVLGAGNYDRTVHWTVNDVTGGDPNVGTITTAGLYTPPASVPNPNVLTITAVSSGDATKTATAALTVIENPFRTDSTFSDVIETEVLTIDGFTVEAAKDEVLLFLTPDITTGELTALKAEIVKDGGVIIGSMADTRTLQVRIRSTASEATFIAAMAAMGGVRTADVNRVVDLEQGPPNEPGYQRYLAAAHSPESRWTSAVSKLALPSEFDDQVFYWMTHVRAPEAWDLSTGSSAASATIGIIDSGINVGQHVVEAGRLARYSWKGTDLGSSEDDTVNTAGGYHGRWVTGFAAGYLDGSDYKVRGMAWKNKVVMVDVFRPAIDWSKCSVGGWTVTCARKLYATDLQAGLKTAIVQGATVVNMSIGVGTTDWCTESSAFRTAQLQAWRLENYSLAEMAKNKNVLLVLAAGNSCETSDDQFYPAGKAAKTSTEPWQTNVLRVSASGVTDDLAWFSNAGEVDDIRAPGDSIAFYAGSGYVDTMEQSLGMKSGLGTSFAAPIVTGTAALLRSVTSDLAAPEARSILIESAKPLASSQRPNVLLDAYAAVNNASAIKVPLDTSIPSITLTKDERKNVTFSVTVPPTTVGSMDIVFLIDTTGSYSDDIDSLQASAQSLITDLSSRGVDVQFGVASFADFPFSPYGYSSTGDRAFYANQTITSDVTAVKAAINSLDNPLHNGDDDNESQLEALYQVATGSGRDLNGNGSFTDAGDLLPINMGWRTGSLHVVVLATDAPFHNSEVEVGYPCGGCTSAGFGETIAALQAKGITVLGLDSGAAYTDLYRVASATGGTVYSLTAANIAATIAEAITDKLANVDLTVKVVSGGSWVDQASLPSFLAVTPGQSRSFTVTLVGKMNNGALDQAYEVYLWVRADGSAILKRVKIPVVVPKK